MAICCIRRLWGGLGCLLSPPHRGRELSPPSPGCALSPLPGLCAAWMPSTSPALFSTCCGTSSIACMMVSRAGPSWQAAGLAASVAAPVVLHLGMGIWACASMPLHQHYITEQSMPLHQLTPRIWHVPGCLTRTGVARFELGCMCCNSSSTSLASPPQRMCTMATGTLPEWLVTACSPACRCGRLRLEVPRVAGKVGRRCQSSSNACGWRAMQ